MKSKPTATPQAWLRVLKVKDLHHQVINYLEDSFFTLCRLCRSINELVRDYKDELRISVTDDSSLFDAKVLTRLLYSFKHLRRLELRQLPYPDDYIMKVTSVQPVSDACKSFFILLCKLPEFEKLQLCLDVQNVPFPHGFEAFSISGERFSLCYIPGVQNQGSTNHVAVLDCIKINDIRHVDMRMLASFTYLKVIVLQRCNISNIRSLSKFRSLTELEISSTGVVDPEPEVRKSHRVLRRELSDMLLSSIQGLPVLRKLNLSSASICDGSLSLLPATLEELVLRETTVSDISGLTHLRFLRTLDLGETQVRNLTALSTMQSLRKLDLCHTSVTNVSPIAGLTLEELNLDDTDIEGGSIVGVGSITSLQVLNISNTHIELDLNLLRNLSLLKELYLKEAAVEEGDTLPGTLTELKILDIGGTTCDASVLGTLTSIQKLYLPHLGITDLSPFKILNSLQVLDLSGTSVADITPLGTLTTLRGLNLSNTETVDISVLASLSSIEVLYLSWLCVTDLSVLDSLRGLRKLDLVGISLADAKLPQWKRLHSLQMLIVHIDERSKVLEWNLPQVKVETDRWKSDELEIWSPNNR